MKIEINMSMDQISDIVRRDLMMYYYMRADPAIGQEDEDDRKALLRVIEMYSSPKQYQDFLEQINES